MNYIVETRVMYRWENCWTEDDQPMTFTTRAEAQAEIDDLLEEMPDYSAEDYRVIGVSE